MRSTGACASEAAAVDDRVVYLDGAAFDQIVSLNAANTSPPAELRELMDEVRVRRRS